MTDFSDCESDAGASPSVSSDESSSSSASSSATTVKITPDVQSTPKKQQRSSNGNSTTTPNVALSSGLLTPLSSGRKPPRKRQLCLPPAPSSSTGGVEKGGTIANTKTGSKLRRESQSINNKPEPVPSTSTTSTKKRKRPPQTLTIKEDTQKEKEDSKWEAERKRKRNKRRRTRSERNMLAGKSGGTPSSQAVTEAVTEAVAQVVTEGEGEESVALDAEIDRVLEEKANKNNLSATNVKSIIRHVITNNMVQKMIMTAMKKKADTADAGGGSSDEDGLVGPKMTRAKTKELLENKQIPLWPNVYSPVKTKHSVSETHMLIQHDLPEDSSGDEEYVPKETDISEMIHTDDESSSVASHTSDVGSPSPVVSKQRTITRRSLQLCETPLISDNDNLFKTPPPRPGAKKIQEGSAISRRTRSKFPLKDTALEDLERQLIPPDVTTDMYDWGTETDNEDWMAFLKDFLNPGKNQHDTNEMDDEADPEYNVMEDDEDLHDREELRRDRAVKVPKKELTQLIAELFEPGMLSGDDMEDNDLASLTGITPLVSDTVDGTAMNSSFPDSSSKDVQSKSCQFNTPASPSTVEVQLPSNSKVVHTNSLLYQVDSMEQERVAAQNRDSTNYVEQVIINDVNNAAAEGSSGIPSGTEAVAGPSCARVEAKEKEEELPLFREEDFRRLHHQMRQHIQLLAQSYVLTASNEHPSLKAIAKTAKSMVIELKNFTLMNGDGNEATSNFTVCNLDSAWNIVNLWPHKFLQQSPIKKKILEEKYISESGVDGDKDKCSKGNHFPRHVVKVIAENSAFLFNNLLPECYGQRNIQTRRSFTCSEDALMVMALDELKDSKKSTAQMADIISSVLLVVCPPSQIYHRIRNLRKSSSSQYSDPAIKKYFTEGILPEVDRTVPEVVDEQPLIQRSREGLSTQWKCLLQHFESLPTYGWEEKISKDPVVKSFNKKKNQRKNSKAKDKSNENDVQVGSSKQFKTIDKVFPNGTYLIENTNPNLQAFPLMNANGKPGAIIYIPKYALNPVTVPAPVYHVNPSRICSSRLGDRTNEMILPHEPKEAIEPEENPLQENIQGAAFTTINLIGLNHLIRRSHKTPMKITPDYPNYHDNNVLMHMSPPKVQPPREIGYHVVQPVGKPFNLNELGYSIPANENGNDHVIDLATLQTPLKNRIFQKAVESENGKQEEDNGDGDDPDIYDEESCNVIEEGTEVELSSDEEEDDVDANLSKQAETVLITLDSDNENDSKNKEEHDAEVKVVSGGNDGNEGKGNSSHSNTNNGSSSSANRQGNEGSHNSSAGANQSFTSRRGSSRPGKGDESDEDNERKGGRKRSLPKDYDKDESSSKENSENNNSPGKDKSNAKRPSVIVSVPSCSPGTSQGHMQPKPAMSASSSHQSSGGNNKPPLNKKAKKSPGNPQVNSRRSSKYNVAPAEQLLVEEPKEFEDVADAYMAAYLTKVQSATEKNHPGLYTTFLQMLMDADPVNQSELYSKVKVLFKDYSELLSEFESFLDPSLEGVNDHAAGAGSSSRDETVAEVEFLQKIEKFTENCPQLKGKVVNKIKTLREKPNLTEKDVANALEHFFSGNPVMMQSFKSLLPGVYRPHSTSSSMDFEEIELDMEDHPKDNSDDLQYEIVKLPDETTVPATSTCPCVCHTKTSDPAFINRSKHCRKCSLKDGKIFFHNGRVMRPVSVELTPAPLSTKPGAVSSTSTSGTTNSSRACSSTVIHETRPRKDSHHLPHLPKSTEFKEPESCNKATDKQAQPFTTGSQHVPAHPVNSTTKPCSQNKVATANEAENSKLRLQQNNSSNQEEAPTIKPSTTNVDSVAVQMPQQDQTTATLLKEEIDNDVDKWTEEEDTVILSNIQEEATLELALDKIAVLLPHRNIEQIKDRCEEIVKMIQEAGNEPQDEI